MAKSIKMNLFGKAYKNLKAIMKKMGFKKDGLFIRYCVSNIIKYKLKKLKEREIIKKELKMIKGRK